VGTEEDREMKEMRERESYGKSKRARVLTND